MVSITLSKQSYLKVTILKTNNLQLYAIQYSYLIVLIDGTLTGTTTQGQSDPGSNVS